MKTLFASVVMMLVCGLACAHDDHYAIDVQHLRVVAVSTAGAPETGTAAIYLTITNRGRATERLMRASTSLAEHVALLRADASAATKPQTIATIEIAAGSTLTMRAVDGPYLQAVGLKAPLKARTKQMLAVEFEQAGKVDVPWLIKAAATTHAH